MADSSIVALVKRIPQFAGLADDDDALAFAVDLAVLSHNVAAWGNVYGQAMAFYAAHLLTGTLADDEGEGASAGGAVTSRKARDLAESYGSVAGSGDSLTDRELSTTRYGRQYVVLKRSRAAGRAFVVRIGGVS